MTADIGEPDSPGPDRGKRCVMRREPLTRNTGEDLSLTNLSTKRQRIAELARTNRGVALSSLHHVIDLEWMKEAYRLTRKDGAPGIDGVPADDYATNLTAASHWRRVLPRNLPPRPPTVISAVGHNQP